MKKKLTSESGIFISRMLLGVLLCAIGVSLAVFALRAQSPPQLPPLKGGTFQLAGGSFVYPNGWAPHDYANMHELWNATADRIASMTAEERDDIARIMTSVTPTANHAEALHRLQEIEAESKGESQYVLIGNWPAFVRRQLIDRPREGDDSGTGNGKMFMVTTAIASGTKVVRMDGFAVETASPELVKQMETMSRSWQPPVAGDETTSTREIKQLSKSSSLRMPPASSPGTSSSSGSAAKIQSALMASTTKPPVVQSVATANLGAAVNLRIGSENEIAVSDNGTYIVVAQGCGEATSQNGGASFSAPQGFPPGHCTGGDSSVAYGKSGNFYWETIDSNGPTCPVVVPPNTNCNNTQGIARSTDNGQTFTFVTNIIDCQTTAGCGFGNIPDQEHIAADRVNLSGSSQDQVYMAFRKGGGGGFGLQCSTDSGANWTAVQYFNNGVTDFPRITVGQDGTVYVITNNGNNIEIWSFSSCQSGLTMGLNHVTVVSGVNQVPCPVAGLDRCNNGNILSSHTVAVDDTNASHLYVSYAVNTVAPAANASFPGNENVLVRESTDGGSTWSSAVQINGGTSGTGGRRFQPWVSTMQGKAYVSWFDRRASSAGSNDLTDFWGASASAGPTAGTEFQIDTNADPQCASGWPCASRNQFDSGSCSTQPQLAGQCRHNPNNNTDSFQACDLNNASPACPMGETCQTGGGCPKYADYTGNAARLGRFYTAWPSATNQPGATGTGGGINLFFAETVVGPTDTTTTYTGDTSGAIGSTANFSATLVLKGTSIPVASQTISFTLGTQGCMGTTNASGVASCSFVLSQTPGPYTVTATFATSGNFNGSSDSKPFTITKATPTISTVASAATTLGNNITDTATVSGGFNPTGTVTFNVYGFIDSTCASPPVFTSTVPLVAGQATSAPFKPTQAGIYHFIATYNGDTNNFPESTACGDANESVTVSGTSVTGSGTVAAASCSQISFTLSAKRNAKNQIVASMYYNDPCANLHFDNPVITSLSFLANQATFGGTVKVLGAQTQNVSFTVVLTDNGTPGTLDKLSISMSNGYSVNANLGSGDISIK